MKRITKLRPSEDPLVPTAETVGQYRDDMDLPSSASPSTGYWIAGHPINLEDLVENSMLYVHRKIRNGEEVGGMFRTSRLCKVDLDENLNGTIETYNSIYKIEDYEEN